VGSSGSAYSQRLSSEKDAAIFAVAVGDLYNFTRVHYSLRDQTPALALGLTQEVRPVLKYLLYPVHVGDLQYQDWAEQRNSVLKSGVDVYERNRVLPIS
jgi:hypothetical protein